MATSQVRAVLFRILFLVVAVSETQSVPVYGCYETCVASQPSDYQNPFNYTEVVCVATASIGQISLIKNAVVICHRLLRRESFLVQMDTPQWMGINHGVDQH